MLYLEKLLSEDERIRKAEEIYYRRKTGDTNTYYKNGENNLKTSGKSVKKMLDIIIVCLFIYTVFYAVQNKDYIFTQEFLASVNKTLCIDLKEKITEIGGFFTQNAITPEQPTDNSIQSDNNSEQNVAENTTNENVATQNNNYIEATLSISEDMSSINQMELDANSIKENYGIIKPLEGLKTSEFGVRSLTNITVSGYHTGLDIAGNTGDSIVAAISGVVAEVSNYGAYGKHVKIVTDDVVTMYAHCSDIYVSEGEEINQGDVIAAVGSTGNSTGPHLHFEIKKEDRYVDPEYLLEYQGD